MAKKAAGGELPALKQTLRGAGLRATPSRAAVLKLLRQASTPMSHGEVADALAPSGWDRATLYRNLLDLTRVGLAHRTDVGDHVWRFEATQEGHDSIGHPHFVCNECGTVACLDGATVVLPRGSRAPRSVRDGGVEIQVKGLCDRCN